MDRECRLIGPQQNQLEPWDQATYVAPLARIDATRTRRAAGRKSSDFCVCERGDASRLDGVDFTNAATCDQIRFHFKIMSPEITATLFVPRCCIPLPLRLTAKVLSGRKDLSEIAKAACGSVTFCDSLKTED